MLRIKSGLSTYEKEASKLGEDWRELAAQRAKEEKVFADLNLPFSLDAQRAGNNEARHTMQGGSAGAGPAANDQNASYEDEEEELLAAAQATVPAWRPSSPLNRGGREERRVGTECGRRG